MTKHTFYNVLIVLTFSFFVCSEGKIKCKRGLLDGIFYLCDFHTILKFILEDIKIVWPVIKKKKKDREKSVKVNANIN